MGRELPFEMRAEAHGRLRTLHLAGELDMSQAASFIDVVTRLSAPGAEVVLDLARVTFIDSSGLRSLLTAYTNATGKGARLIATHVPPVVAKMIETAGLRSRPPFTAARTAGSRPRTPR
jgi:anti-anti-sigma factor